MDNREIDRLVAEKVMGWKVEVAMDGQTEYYDNGSLAENKWVEDVGMFEKDNIDVFKPSEKIQDAWLVIKAMEEQMFIVDLNVWRDENECVFTSLDYENKYEGTASTIEIAICLAALKSTGIEVSS